MKKHLLLTLFCLVIFVSNAQDYSIINMKPGKPLLPGVVEGCEDAKGRASRLDCGQEKLRSIAFEALQDSDVNNIINSTEKDTIIMNTIIRFGGENEILSKLSSLRFYESELKPFAVDLSFPIEALPFRLNQDFKADGTPFENYLFLKIDRENKQLIPLPDYEPKRIPFSGPDVFIVYKGCKKKWGNKRLRKCMSEKINKHVGKYFNTKIAKEHNLYGPQRILVQFTVSKEGNPIKIKVRAPHPELSIEMERVIQKLPKMKPAQIEGEPVNTRFTLPVLFNVR
jgi:hypothetical protein